MAAKKRASSPPRYGWLALQKMSDKGRQFFRQVTRWDETWQSRFWGVTREQAEWLLDCYLKHNAALISRKLGANIAQNQFDALVSWSEARPFRRVWGSRLFGYVRSKPYAVPAEMRKWCTDERGVWCPHLAERRKNEARLFEIGYLQ